MIRPFALALLTTLAGCASPPEPPTPPATLAPAAADLAAAFLAEMASRAAATEEPVIAGRDGWLFFTPELRHLGVGPFWGERAAAVSRATSAQSADPLPAIVDFHQQLERAGIELLFVPVPAKALVYPDAISDVVDPSPPRLDPHHQEFFALLAANGVEVVDLLPLFLVERAADTGDLYCRQDTHWSPLGIRVAAREIARRIGERPWHGEQPTLELASEPRDVTITGDLWRQHPEPRPDREELTVEVVGSKTAAGLEPVMPVRSSPVLLLGDSHVLVFHAGAELHAKGAGLADHLALELGYVVDVVGVRGSGATPSRVNLLRRGDGLTGKRLVVWCLSARELTEGSGWRKVPITR